MAVKIFAVLKNSVCTKNGIRPGDSLVSINGNEINDVLDYRFHIMEKCLLLLIELNGEKLEIQIQKPEYSDIVLNFSTYLMDDKKRCRNNCIF